MACATALSLLPVLFPGLIRAQEASGSFYAIGNPSDSVPNGSTRLYEMDSTAHVLRSTEMNVTSGMLTGDRTTIVLVDNHDAHGILFLVSLPSLQVRVRMDVPASQMPTDQDGNRVPCLDHIFVHPVTGLAYFFCQTGGRSLAGQFAIDSFNKRILHTDLSIDAATRDFLYDPKRQWLYIAGGAPKILDMHNTMIGQIGDNVVPGRHSFFVTDMALLPNGNLILLSDVATLSLYDPAAQRVLRAWTEDREVVHGELHTVVYDVPVPSRDGSRLFGIEVPPGGQNARNGGILWDTATLQPIRRWTLPEPESDRCSGGNTYGEGMDSGLAACFIPAPDGRGMWYFGKSGKIYRLDDHTGDLIEEVKLPFHLISLIREPK